MYPGVQAHILAWHNDETCSSHCLYLCSVGTCRLPWKCVVCTCEGNQYTHQRSGVTTLSNYATMAISYANTGDWKWDPVVESLCFTNCTKQTAYPTGINLTHSPVINISLLSLLIISWMNKGICMYQTSCPCRWNSTPLRQSHACRLITRTLPNNATKVRVVRQRWQISVLTKQLLFNFYTIWQVSATGSQSIHI